MLQFRKLVGDITYSHTREGFVYLAGRDGTAYSAKDCWLRPSRDTCEPACPHNALQKLAVRNCQPIEGVTIFHVESRDRSTRPLTTPPP